MDSSHLSLLVFLDLTAAFDTINHQKLLQRLSSEYGFCSLALKWLETYLVGRTQYVRVGQASGPLTPCLTGVPQGSVLGPLLFSIYISPISRLIGSHGVLHHKYADDTTLYVKLGNQPDNDTAIFEQCLTDTATWFLENDMQLNPSKSEAMLLGTAAKLQKSSPAQPLSINGSPIPTSKHIKIIGVTFDNSLTFNQHTSNICQESNFHIRALRHIRPLIDQTTANTLACSIVHSRLDYCNSLLAGTSDHNIKRLQVVQNNLARVVCSASRRDSATELLKKLHWLPIKYRIEYKLAAITHKVINDKSPVYLSDCISEHKPTRNLRSSCKCLLTVPQTRTITGSCAFRATAPQTWNALPESLRSTTSHEAFLKNLKTFYFHSAFSQ